MTTKDGFGTVLVLAASIEQIGDVIAKASSKVAAYGVVEDPTYPYRANSEIASLIPDTIDTIPRQVNGDTTLLWRKETTCAYIFGSKEELQPILGHLPLHP
jgi:hypothetical protein